MQGGNKLGYGYIPPNKVRAINFINKTNSQAIVKVVFQQSGSVPFSIPSNQTMKIQKSVNKETWTEYDFIKTFFVNEKGTYPVVGICDDAVGLQERTYELKQGGFMDKKVIKLE